jgi:hypothetical protein
MTLTIFSAMPWPVGRSSRFAWCFRVATYYEVRHPENALFIRGGIYVAQHDNGDLPERAVYCSLLHIAAVETLAST